MIQVTGILTTPMGQLSSNTTIRVIALDTTGDTIPTIPASTITGSDGSYDFNLLNGVYSIEVNFSNKYNLIKEVTITNSTVSPITLANLLKVL